MYMYAIRGVDKIRDTIEILIEIAVELGKPQNTMALLLDMSQLLKISGFLLVME